MRRVAWLAALLLLTTGCGDESVDAPLPTYTGTPEVTEPFYARGSLGLVDQCLVVHLDARDGAEPTPAILRLPSDAGAELRWQDDRLWFHGRRYELGATMIFRATVSDTADVSDVPEPCQASGIESTATAVPGTTDLTLDPSASVIGAGDQLRVPVAELSGGGMDALMRADLAVVGGRCLGVEAPGTDTLLIWPYGTTVSYDPDPVVLLPDGMTYAVGDRLDLSGGYVSEPDTPGAQPAAPIDQLPEECQQLGRFLVSPFQP